MEKPVRTFSGSGRTVGGLDFVEKAKELIRLARDQGHLTYEDVNDSQGPDEHADDAIDGEESETHFRQVARAYQRMLEYLQETRGLSPEDAYVLSSLTVDLKIAELVNGGQHVVTALLPLAIFR